jgi:nucleotide-binding universal stress UspA family protein
VGYDGSPQGRDALALGTLLAGDSGRVVAARIFPATPRLLPGPAATRYRAKHDAEQRALVEELHAAARELGVDTEHPVARSPAAGLHDLAAELAADLVVIGSSGRGAGTAVFAGGTAERLLHGSPCAVAVAPLGFREREQALRVIGVGYDGSPEADIALDEAIGLADQHEATMRIFSVLPPTAPASERQGLGSGARDYFEHASRRAWERAPENVRAAAVVVAGEPAAVLRDEAEKGLDLLALGSRGFGPLQRVVSGSVAAALVQGLACPLLVFPRGTETAPLERLQVKEPATG